MPGAWGLENSVQERRDKPNIMGNNKNKLPASEFCLFPGRDGIGKARVFME